MGQAIDSLDLMRIKEGEAIEADFVMRLDLLEKHVDEVEKRAPDLVEEYRKRLKDNIERMLKGVSMERKNIVYQNNLDESVSKLVDSLVKEGVLR